MRFTDWIQSHRRSLLFLIALLVAGGVLTGRQLPVSLFPRISFPRIEVDLDAGDRPADRMAIEVTRPVEEAVRGVPGVVNIRSTTTRGSAAISVRFEWGQDMVTRMLELESAVNEIRSNLPGDATFTVRRMDPTVYPVLAYSMTSDTLSPIKLRDIAYYQLRPVLSAVPGVQKVGVQGGEEEEYHVTIAPKMLASFGLTMEEVSSALSAANVITAVGRMEDHYKLYLVVSDTRFDNLASVGQTVLRSGEDGVVLLEDVATVSRSVVPRWTRVTADGHQAVTLEIYQQRGANTVRIDNEVKARLDGYRKHFPPGVISANGMTRAI